MNHLPLALLAAALLGFPQIATAQVVTRNVAVKAHFDDYPPGVGSPFGAGYASCWSYVHGDGREYAVIGTTKGTAFYNVTDPDNAYWVSFIPGISSGWREMKSYRNWIYVVTEGFKPASGDPVVAPGIQIIRMTDPENPVVAGVWSGSFNRAHTVSVDTTRALLICNGTNLYTPPSSQVPLGIRILSLASPESPIEVGWWPGGAVPVTVPDYVHDSVPIGTRLYASSIYSGIARILDLADPANPTALASWTYPGAFSHNAWPDASGNVLYVTDEVTSEPLKIFDITGMPATPPLVNTLTSNPRAIVHNAHVLGDELFLANYTEGTRFLDISDPRHPAEYGFADSYPGGSGGFAGVWGVCPYFPSGTVIASDMQTGLWVYRPVRDYGLVHVQVTDDSMVPIAGAKVYATTLGDSATTPADGVVRFAPSPGSHTLKVVKFGYVDASVTLPVTMGSLDTVSLVLTPRPLASLSGVIRELGDAKPLDEGEVDLRYTFVHEHTDPAGGYAIADVPADRYRIEIHRPGYVPIGFDYDLAPGPNICNFDLIPAATWDDLETGSGWTVGATGDDATAGQWVHVAPLGTSTAVGAGGFVRAAGIEGRGPGFALEHQGHEEDGAAPGQVAPGEDRTPVGTQCWVTGQGTNPANVSEADIDGGHTTLTSPAFDLSAMSDPALGYWAWFYTQFGHADDWFAVSISNDDGASWAPVDTLRELRNHWIEYTIHVADYVTPTNQVRLRFVAADHGVGTVVEAAVDDVVAYDLALIVSAGGPMWSTRLALRALGANPGRGAAAFALENPAARDADIGVFDVGGRRVRTLLRGPVAAGMTRLAWDGATDAGRTVPAGLYFVRALAGGESAQARFVRMR